KRHQRALSPLSGPSGRPCRRGRLVGEGVLLFRQRHHGKSAATPPSSVTGSQLNAIYFESSGKSVPEFNVEIHGWVPTQF
ncbi:hypothetical protein ATANTOWER_021775, partial [Ataeniobius toweri]|nr:hypothetical protein [Ataeniobius toweri]